MSVDFCEKHFPSLQNETMSPLEIQKRQIVKDEIRRLQEQTEKMNRLECIFQIFKSLRSLVWSGYCTQMFFCIFF